MYTVYVWLKYHVFTQVHKNKKTKIKHLIMCRWANIYWHYFRYNPESNPTHTLTYESRLSHWGLWQHDDNYLNTLWAASGIKATVVDLLKERNVNESVIGIWRVNSPLWGIWRFFFSLLSHRFPTGPSKRMLNQNKIADRSIADNWNYFISSHVPVTSASCRSL